MFHCTLPEAGRKPGGVEVAVHRLANALTVSHSVTVYSLSDAPADAKYHHVRLFRSWGRLLRRTPLRLTLLPILLNFVDWGDADVIHLHGDDWFFMWRPRPTVRTLHGSALREAAHSTTVIQKWAYLVVYQLERISARMASIAVAGGPDAAAIYGTTEVADYGVDLGLFHPRPKTETPSVFFVGTWNGRKRGRFLFDQFTSGVLSANPDCVMYMACDFVPTHEAVVDLGFPNDNMLADHMGRAWVFAYPSEYEGFGIPYLEALASGTAVVSSPNPGAEYVLEDGKLGVIAGDETFALAINNLLADPLLRRRYERLGMHKAAALTWEAIAVQYASWYARALSGRRRKC